MNDKLYIEALGRCVPSAEKMLRKTYGYAFGLSPEEVCVLNCRYKDEVETRISKLKQFEPEIDLKGISGVLLASAETAYISMASDLYTRIQRCSKIGNMHSALDRKSTFENIHEMIQEIQKETIDIIK